MAIAVILLYNITKKCDNITYITLLLNGGVLLVIIGVICFIILIINIYNFSKLIIKSLKYDEDFTEDEDKGKFEYCLFGVAIVMFAHIYGGDIFYVISTYFSLLLLLCFIVSKYKKNVKFNSQKILKILIPFFVFALLSFIFLK
ncbi:hypothetical protein [Cellulosilyticum lentocellum]|uniref:Uncharacterized protein n=1 Tax=Cellulosilyticum lentocellum (strain ATCC 49066 / DSM 5427 / NCIMB 11756 / RHM5) TaxID=642492 RepID=F2JNZ0_CELLD|nr:hypothetical protein [Cellulosilyticum lentocellum]ADZ83604.1 hypothetical protein Clole_1884 [Cellulosilyticum lentocellum DSM 5427]